jgi:protein-S-isoprenylcysteine O-methyltransferase Ste14
MSWAFCLPSGKGYSSPLTFILFNHAFKIPFPIAYFYVVYFAVLLIHRERRDDDKCFKKYGKAWEEYKKKVKYRIIPFLY